MPSLTADQGLSIPVGADAASAMTAFGNYNSGVESRLAKRYVDLADRTARNPAPTAGEISYLTAPGRADTAVAGGIWWELRPIFIRKATETQVVNNSTVFVADSHLILPMVANARYELTGTVFWDSGTTGDIKFDWTVPAGGTVPFWTVTAPDTALAFNTAISQGAATAIARGGAGIGTFVAGLFTGQVVTAGTAGNLTLRWAQNAAEAVNTRIKTESWLKLIRVG